MSYSLSVFLSLSLFLSLFLFPSVTLPPSPPASLPPSIFYNSSCSLKFPSLLLSFWQPPIAVQTERAYYHYHCVDWYLHPQHLISYFCLNTGYSVQSIFEIKCTLLINHKNVDALGKKVKTILTKIKKRQRDAKISWNKKNSDILTRMI